MNIEKLELSQNHSDHFRMNAWLAKITWSNGAEDFRLVGRNDYETLMNKDLITDFCLETFVLGLPRPGL